MTAVSISCTIFGDQSINQEKYQILLGWILHFISLQRIATTVFLFIYYTNKIVYMVFLYLNRSDINNKI